MGERRDFSDRAGAYVTRPWGERAEEMIEFWAVENKRVANAWRLALEAWRDSQAGLPWGDDAWEVLAEDAERLDKVERWRTERPKLEHLWPTP